MPNSDLETLHKRLKHEVDHLEWFRSSGQTMDKEGSGGRAQYIANAEAAIATLKARIAEMVEAKAP